MPNNNLPTGWGNQQSSPPKGWGKSPSDHTKPKIQPPTKAIEDVNDIQSKSNELDNPPSNNSSSNTEINQNKTVDSSESEITSVGEEETTDNSKDYEDSYENFVVQEIEKDVNKKNRKSSEDKKPKTLRISTLVLAVILTATISFLIVFICLYFSGNKDNNTNNVEPSAIIETTEEIMEEVTEQETTEAETTEPTTVEETTVEQETTYDYSDYDYPNEQFESYTINIINRISTYSGPSYFSDITGEITYFTEYTIVDEAYDEYGFTWGKLESDFGWINISAATENWMFNADSSYYNPNDNQDMKTKAVGDFVFCYYPLSPSDAIEGDYFEKIDSVDISQISDYTFRIHIKGEVNDEYGLDKQESLNSRELTIPPSIWSMKAELMKTVPSLINC